ncbi:MAG TPA: hypothetical protein VFS20_12290 [Longimicrobium sp.]|nr:hypothetical protein [Longimicrobium sp.]
MLPNLSLLRRPRTGVALLLGLTAVAGCTPGPAAAPAANPSAAAAPTPARPGELDRVAEAYVKLVLALGQHDADYVDAYYGPPAWKTEAEAAKLPLATIRARAAELRTAVAAIPTGGLDEMQRLRRKYLDTQLRALQGRLDFLDGKRLSFDEESRVLYDAVAPNHPESYYQELLTQLDRALPGTGAVAERYAAWRQAFVIPRERLDTVFKTAIAACRERTMGRLQLPAGESFTVEYVNNKPWSGYNWYQGNYRSLIQVNTDLPIFVDRAIDLACHEGYPGHHVYNALLEKNLVRDRGWVEFSVYPLFSPQSLIAEGSANYGIAMAFPGHEREAFERERIFPLAGIDAARADEYYRVQGLADRLSYAGNEAARSYLNGQIDSTAAAAWITRYALMEPARARQRVRFIDKYRSYVINYNLGKDLVRQYVESRGGNDPQRRWQVFGELLSSPRLPSDLQ